MNDSDDALLTTMVEPDAGIAQSVTALIRKKRGPENKRQNSAVTAMVEAVTSGKMSAFKLENLKQKELEGRFPQGKRTTLVSARRIALTKLTKLRQNSGKTPTNDK